VELETWFISRHVVHYLRDISMVYEGNGVRSAETLLKKAGFDVSQSCYSRPSCFDLAARRDENLILVKVQPDIDSLSPSDSAELNGISKSISATSIMISQNAREKPLEDDTVYSRYNISAITPKTFENIVFHKTYPLIQAGPGGYYVEIDGPAIRHRRQQLGLSVGKVAEMVGKSRRTLYGYERGMAKASVTVAYNLICTLGIPVAKPSNVLERPAKEHKCLLLTTARRVIAQNRLLMKVFMKFNHYGVTTVRKAPFDFIMTVPEEKTKIIGGVTEDKELHLDRRVDEILSVSRVVQAHPILVTERLKLHNKSIQCVRSKEFFETKNLKDLIGNFT
jgi:putative transcriptional regulator